MFKLTFRTDNAAFSDYPELEIARILRETADRVEAGHAGLGHIHDFNGNTVGNFNTTRK